LSLAVAAVTREPLWAALVLGPYAVASVTATLAAGRSDPPTMAVLPVVFAAMHLSWGLGFFAGLWRFRTSLFGRATKP
jgi:hypothetical protein